MIIGLGYRARSGKDTVARYLRDRHKFTHTWFAQPLKEAAARLFWLSPEQLYGDLKEVPDPFWNDTPRNILQKFGTECLRKGYRDDFWIKVLERRIDSWRPSIQDIVVSDVRFRNEAEAVKAWGGKLWKIDRPQAPSVLQHASETELDGWQGWDVVIDNSGSLESLTAQVDQEIGRIRGTEKQDG